MQKTFNTVADIFHQGISSRLFLFLQIMGIATSKPIQRFISYIMKDMLHFLKFIANNMVNKTFSNILKYFHPGFHFLNCVCY